MGYDLYITRADFWMDEKHPVTLKEIEEIWDRIPRGFSIDRTGTVSATTPSGQTLSVDTGDYLVYQNVDDKNMRVHIYFREGKAPVVRGAVEDASVRALAELARLLHAQLQGEEGEVYT